jgi:hypothetical protein
MWISAYPFVEIDDFLKVPHLVWVWDFVDMYLAHLETRIWSPTIHNYSKNRFFWTPKDCCPPFVGAKKNFFFNFECYDLTNGKEWECDIW